MRDFLVLFVHLIVSVVRLVGPGGLRSVVAESALLRHQLLILNRGRNRAPNLRAVDRLEIKTVPYVPLSHSFKERLIGTIRREYFDRTLFWTTVDLETKLLDFQSLL